jgi:hypothetical protein
MSTSPVISDVSKLININQTLVEQNNVLRNSKKALKKELEEAKKVMNGMEETMAEATNTIQTMATSVAKLKFASIMEKMAPKGGVHADIITEIVIPLTKEGVSMTANGPFVHLHLATIDGKKYEYGIKKDGSGFRGYVTQEYKTCHIPTIGYGCVGKEIETAAKIIDEYNQVKQDIVRLVREGKVSNKCTDNPSSKEVEEDVDFDKSDSDDSEDDKKEFEEAISSNPIEILASLLSRRI